MSMSYKTVGDMIAQSPLQIRTRDSLSVSQIAADLLQGGIRWLYLQPFSGSLWDTDLTK